MAGILAAVYSLIVLAVALAGVLFVFRNTSEGGLGEAGWATWTGIAFVSLFLLAMVGSLLA